jgi:hypothetical protein
MNEGLVLLATLLDSAVLSFGAAALAIEPMTDGMPRQRSRSRRLKPQRARRARTTKWGAWILVRSCLIGKFSTPEPRQTNLILRYSTGRVRTFVVINPHTLAYSFNTGAIS